jgi:hypothetical protein
MLFGEERLTVQNAYPHKNDMPCMCPRFACRDSRVNQRTALHPEQSSPLLIHIIGIFCMYTTHAVEVLELWSTVKITRWGK